MTATNGVQDPHTPAPWRQTAADRGLARDSSDAHQQHDSSLGSESEGGEGEQGTVSDWRCSTVFFWERVWWTRTVGFLRGVTDPWSKRERPFW